MSDLTDHTEESLAAMEAHAKHGPCTLGSHELLRLLAEVHRHRATDTKRCTCDEPPMSGHLLWCEALRGQPEFRPDTDPARAADAERVRSVVREALTEVFRAGQRANDAAWRLSIASRVAEQLAAAVGLSAEDRATFKRLREAEGRTTARERSAIDRLLTSPPTPDLRSAIAALLDSDAPAGELRRDLARLIGRESTPKSANDERKDHRDQDNWHDLWDGDARMPRDR